MPDRPTLEHTRLSALELKGRPIEITSAELVRTQHWLGDETAQQEWEIVGRTYDATLSDGPQPVVLTVDGRRLKGRVVLTASRSIGSDLWAFNGVGLGDLVETS